MLGENGFAKQIDQLAVLRSVRVGVSQASFSALFSLQEQRWLIAVPCPQKENSSNPCNAARVELIDLEGARKLRSCPLKAIRQWFSLNKIAIC